jgi:hypothetical protein
MFVQKPLKTLSIGSKAIQNTNNNPTRSGQHWLRYNERLRNVFPIKTSYNLSKLCLLVIN